MITDYILDYIFRFLKTYVNKMHLIKSLQDTKHLEDYAIFLDDALRYFNIILDKEMESVFYPTENKKLIPRIKIPFEDLEKINLDFIKEYNQKLFLFIRNMNKSIELTFKDIEGNALSPASPNKSIRVFSERSEICIRIILLLDSLNRFYRFIYSGVLIPQEKEKNLHKVIGRHINMQMNKRKVANIETELKLIESESKRYPSWKAVCEITVVCLFGYAVTQGVISAIQWLRN